LSGRNLKTPTREPRHSVADIGPYKAAVNYSYLNYRGGTVTMPVALFCTDQSIVKSRDAALGWAPWLRGGYQLQNVPGTHQTMFDPEFIEHTALAARRSIDASAP
jgi:thioesterase domain-containing protein